MINTDSLTPIEKDIFDKIISKMPSTIRESDLSIYLAMYAMLAAAAQERLDNMYRQLDIDTATEPYLRLIAELIGYIWVETLSVESNRSRMRYNSYIRKYRGTVESLRNLVKAAANEDRFLNNTENDLITIEESNIGPLFFTEENSIYIGAATPDFINNMSEYIQELFTTYRYVITIHVPEELMINRTDIDDVRPAGTVVYFAYRIMLKQLNNIQILENDRNLIYFQSPYVQEMIQEYGLSTPIGHYYSYPFVDISLSPQYLRPFYPQLTLETA